MIRQRHGTQRLSFRGETGNFSAPCNRRSHHLGDSTLENAYSKIIASFVNSQQEHLNLADALNVQVVGVLTSLARKNEGYRKKARANSLRYRSCDVLI
jgi:hypothetical protein